MQATPTIYSAFKAGRAKRNGKFIYNTFDDFNTHIQELNNIPLMNDETLRVQTPEFKDLYTKYIDKLANDINKKY